MQFWPWHKKAITFLLLTSLIFPPCCKTKLIAALPAATPLVVCLSPVGPLLEELYLYIEHNLSRKHPKRV
jgi:hypothetical protein